ncbi:MAG: ribonuclease HII [Candidatus Omnitrophica bacterium]|nr:ribonuclease HII [Candidatus Omnitrophota bacterium]
MPANLSPSAPNPSPSSRKPTQPDLLARAAGYQVIAGIDEAGCGPWAGPVVAAAVVLRRRLLPVRIDDSKRLSPAQREAAFEAIQQHAAVGVGIVPAAVVDRQNIRRAALSAMETALRNLACAPELVIVDGNCAPRVDIPCWTVVGGDHLSYPVACASIIAKVTRDALMRFYHRLFPVYGFEQHKGYGTRLHLARLQAYGPCALHRLTFEPVAALLRNSSPSAHESGPAASSDEPAELAGVSLEADSAL